MPTMPTSPDFADRPTAADAAYDVNQLDDVERLARFLAIFQHFRLIDYLRADRNAGRLDIDTYSWEVFHAIADILPGLDSGSVRAAIASLPPISTYVVAEPAVQGAGEAEKGIGD